MRFDEQFEQREKTKTATLCAKAQAVPANWIYNSANYQRDICLHQLFEQQVARTPDALCLAFGDTTLTYQEMNARANQVAHYLHKLGVQPETLVGICMERSLEMVITMYGILKAGGAYVPLDPSYPGERLAFMLTDANPPVLITQQQLLRKLPPQRAQVICLDTEWKNIAQESDANIDSGVTEKNLAYVMYTSGSTGQPKGVLIEHRGICNQLQWMQDRYPMTSNDAVLVKTPFSFDLSLYEFFSPLIAGAQLVMANPDGQKDPGYLVELIQRARITALFIVPSHLQMLLEQPGFTMCHSLQRIFCSGEALPFALQQRFFAALPAPITLHNLYGPTEASVECTYWDCERNTNRTIVPVGRPIANYEIHILDEQGHPVPVGVAGELHIGGIGLARGYLNRSSLTEEKFRVSSFGLRDASPKDEAFHPYPENPKLETQNSKRETILYKTGDLARWLPDGVIECLGRIDFQVKIRGHRIELGEIETALTTHPVVRECVVIAHEDESGDKKLIAYFVAPAEAILANDELRAFLQQKLPDYMLPASFVRLEALPLSPNGKIDRRQLPAPEEIQRQRTTAIVAPADELECKLTTLWEKILRVAPISVTDNFFALGGHSLLAVRIFAALENERGQKLPLALLFQAPTIRQLAALLHAPNWQPSWSTLVPLQPKGTKPPFFCVHAVGGNVLEYYELAQHFNPDQPFYGLQANGLDGVQTPRTSITAMATEYRRAIQSVQAQGPYYLGGRSFGGVVAYEMARQLHAQGEQVALVALLDTDPIGWLKLFPKYQAHKYRAHFLALRIKRHYQNLRGLSTRAKLFYLREKVAYKKRLFAAWNWQFRRQFKARQKRPTTEVLREVEEFNYLAEKNYVPRIYPGHVTFFSAVEEVSSTENQFGWERLATGGVETVAVPGNHQTMIASPHVQTLAAQLQLRLAPSSTKPEQSHK